MHNFYWIQNLPDTFLFTENFWFFILILNIDFEYMKTTPSGGFDYNNLDRQIADIFKCKPLPELEVRALCEKV